MTNKNNGKDYQLCEAIKTFDDAPFVECTRLNGHKGKHWFKVAWN